MVHVLGGTPHVSGGPGYDVVDFAGFQERLTLDLLTGEASGSFLVGSFTVNAFEEVRGSSQSDHILGTEESDVLRGRGGDDQLEGRGGRDDLIGGRGDDSADGGEGDDTCKAEIMVACERS